MVSLGVEAGWLGAEDSCSSDWLGAIGVNRGPEIGICHGGDAALSVGFRRGIFKVLAKMRLAPLIPDMSS